MRGADCAARGARPAEETGRSAPGCSTSSTSAERPPAAARGPVACAENALATGCARGGANGARPYAHAAPATQHQKGKGRRRSSRGGHREERARREWLLERRRGERRKRPPAWRAALLFLLLHSTAHLGVSWAQSPDATALLAAKAQMTDSGGALGGWTGGDPCAWFGVSCTGGNVTTLDLSYSGLSGSLPSALSAVVSLAQLSLQSNAFSGSLPPAWSTLSALSLLELQSNSISGVLPSAWAPSMLSLVRLNLAGNQLQSTIPSSWGGLGNLTRLVLDSNSNMCGAVPAGLSGKATFAGTGIPSACPSPPPPPPGLDYGLLQLKAAVTSDPNGALSSWTAATAGSMCSTWAGVQCTGGVATGVDVAFNQLQVNTPRHHAPHSR